LHAISVKGSVSNICLYIFFATFLLLTGCGEKISESDEQNRVVEASIENQFPGKIKRNGGKLTVRATSGDEHVFQDRRDENIGENYVTHLASSRFPGLDWVVVSSTYYEGGEKSVINVNSGAVFHFDGHPDPIVSPDNQRAVFYSQDIDAGYTSNYIAIYRIDQNTMQLEVEFDGDGNEKDSWGPENPRWLNNEVLAYDEVRYVSDSSLQAIHIQLKRIEGKWKQDIVGKPFVIKRN